mgnify:FL=1
MVYEVGGYRKIKETASLRQSGMGNPARGRGLPLKMHGLRPYGHGDETAGGEEYQRTQETGWDGVK